MGFSVYMVYMLQHYVVLPAGPGITGAGVVAVSGAAAGVLHGV